MTDFPPCGNPNWCTWKICKDRCFYAGKCNWRDQGKISLNGGKESK